MNKIPILYYHSIAPSKDSKWYKSYLTYELKYFEDLVRYLSSAGYTFLFLDEYFELRQDKSAKNKNLICLTFDDGYLDNYVYVFPLLKKYKAKGTIFISPEYVPNTLEPNLTIEDVWNSKIKIGELKSLGYASWKELEIMQKSGIVDIQSHTMTHTKYYRNDKIREFHHPKSNYLYPIANLNLAKKPNYIADENFIHLLPYGFPFFEEQSAMIVKKVSINEEFENECVEILKDTDWTNYNFNTCFLSVKKLYESYLKAENLITKIESQIEYEKRIRVEISESKRIIEKKLQKKVNHICWPHGDYNELCHQIAIEEGYSSTHLVLKGGGQNNYTDRYNRIATGAVKNNRFLTLLKAKAKIKSYRSLFPYSILKSDGNSKY